MSWINRTPSDRSLTREVIGGYPCASSLVFSLRTSSTMRNHSSKRRHIPFTERPLLSITRTTFRRVHRVHMSKKRRDRGDPGEEGLVLNPGHVGN